MTYSSGSVGNISRVVRRWSNSVHQVAGYLRTRFSLNTFIGSSNSFRSFFQSLWKWLLPQRRYIWFLIMVWDGVNPHNDNVTVRWLFRPAAALFQTPTTNLQFRAWFPLEGGVIARYGRLHKITHISRMLSSVQHTDMAYATNMSIFRFYLVKSL